jgi:AcrR family transcriptional regulator
MLVKSRRADHAADTRRALVTSARRLFGQRGYAATSLDDICDRAGVTKGALYHHFRNKEDLFVEALEQVEEDLVRAGAADVQPSLDLWDALRAASRGFLDACSRPGNRRIITEAPAVLGWQRCREVEDRHGVALLRSAFEHAAAEGTIASRNPRLLAQLLVALFNEAGTIVASASDPEPTRAAVSEELDAVIHGLSLTPPTTRTRAAGRRRYTK